ncbi:MAG TPA: hypothetical protein VIG84_09620 [Brevundimonas sp.]
MTDGGLILIVEDDETKYADILTLVTDLAPDLIVERASTIKAAERFLDHCVPDLLVLDVSMNIADGSLGPMRGGFANLGGIDLLDRMYHLGRLCPTVIVTGFDAFRTKPGTMNTYEMVDLTELTHLASRRLGPDYFGLVRYSDRGWKTAFSAALAGWRAR